MSLSYSDIDLLWTELQPEKPLSACLYVDVNQQTLKLYQFEKLLQSYVVSTAVNGVGNETASYKTPSGFHKIDEKIGANQPINMLFKGRKPTGEIAQLNDPLYLKEDSITSRILWLTGLQLEVNLSGNVDTKQRYIYIHGTADEAHLGQAVSHGCIRMKNTDILDLFDLVDENTVVYIA